MASALRRTGISVVGDVPWGTHFCQFYETKDDLLDTLVPYFLGKLLKRYGFAAGQFAAPA